MAEVVQVEPLTQYILKIVLKPEHFVNYKAGQYLQILTADEALCFSIANAPLGAHQYELHIRHSPDNPSLQRLMQEIRKEGSVPIYLPLGDCQIEKISIDRPLMMLAQGTGFAPMKAMIEQWLIDGQLPPILFCWLAWTDADWYMRSLVEKWDAEVDGFHYVPMQASLSDETVLKTLLKQSGFDQKTTQFVLAGPFERMHMLRKVGIQLGLKKAQFLSDAF